MRPTTSANGRCCHWCKAWLLSGVRLIRTLGIAPGFIDTPMTQALPEEIRKEWINKIPLRRGGTVEDIANVATFLASELSSYVSGQVIQVDGGMNM